MTQLQLLDPQALHPAADNVRRNVGDVDELAASIRSVGLLEPIIATPDEDGTLMIVAGARRHAAARQAGLTQVPVIVREMDHEERVEAMLVENLQRSELAPLEEADGYRRLVDFGRTQRQISQRVGRSQAHISKRLALLTLTPKARAKLDSGRITLEQALELTKLADHPDRLDRALAAGASSWEVKRELEKVALERKTEGARAKLAAQKIPVVSWAKAISKRTAYRGIGKELPWQFDPLDGVDARRHRSEPCHAATISEDGWSAGRTIPLCTNPSRHAKTGDSKLKTTRPPGRKRNRSAREEKRAARNRMLKKTGAARDKIMSELLGGSIASSRRTLIDYVLRIFIADLRQTPLRCAGPVLGLDSKQFEQTRAKINMLAAAGGDDLLRAAAAAAFGIAEELIRSPYPTREQVAPHLRWFAQRGHPLSDAETELLADIDADIDADRAAGVDDEPLDDEPDPADEPDDNQAEDD